MAEPAIRCAWCGEAIEQDDAGSWTGPWRGYEGAEDLIEGTEARQYCLKSPDHKHAPTEEGDG
jgi:hypothetical protein